MIGMSTIASPPEAQGPAIEGPAGEVIYGHNSRATVFVQPRMSAEERDREMAGNLEDTGALPGDGSTISGASN